MLASLAPAAGASLVPLLGLPVPPVASALPTSIGGLDPNHPVLTFTGGVDNPTPLPLVSSPVPVVCAVTCQAYTFNAITTTPFLVSVKDAAASTSNGWDLSVYAPSGRLAGAANGIGANGQAIRVDHPAAGRYEVFVTFTYAYDAAAAFNGEVRLLSAPTWDPAPPTCNPSGVAGCFDLPVLRGHPPSDLHVDGVPPAASTPLGFPLPVSIPTGFSCYLDETIQLGPTRCLRFTSNVGNTGNGLLDLRLTYSAGQCTTAQLLHRAVGEVASRPAGACLFHPTHGHFHYADFVGFSLHRLLPNRTPGPQIGAGLKQSFCLADNDYFGFGKARGNGPNTYAGQPDCSLPAAFSGTDFLLAEGLSPGWGDVYTWDTPGQIIDITTTPPGDYALVEKTNPSGSILVAGPAQTCSMTILRLDATSVTSLSAHPSIACPR